MEYILHGINEYIYITINIRSSLIRELVDDLLSKLENLLPSSLTSFIPTYKQIIVANTAIL